MDAVLFAVDQNSVTAPDTYPPDGQATARQRHFSWKIALTDAANRHSQRADFYQATGQHRYECHTLADADILACAFHAQIEQCSSTAVCCRR